MSAQKYYSVLVKQTNAGFPHTVADRYRELHATHRRYCHLKNVKRSGMGYEIHPLEKHKDYAVQCVACPAPLFNYDPKLVPFALLYVLWSGSIFMKSDHIHRVFFRIWMSYDGNFQNSRKAKKVDKGDICLSDGLQYYVKNEPYEQWAKVGGSERQVGFICYYGRLSKSHSFRRDFAQNATTTRLGEAIPMAPGEDLMSLGWGCSVVHGTLSCFHKDWSTSMAAKSRAFIFDLLFNCANYM